MKSYLISLLCLCLVISPASAQIAGDIYDLSLHELSQLRVSSGATLTKTEAGKVPAAITVITRNMITESGARSLDELLDIYVPNYYRLRHVNGPHFGMRGIIHSRDNKTLLIVNGRIMNHRASLGAISERSIPLLGDIESIEVVRGPGSAVYGPGAINGVINIRTFSEKSFRGLTADFSNGLIEGYTAGQIRAGKSFGRWGDVSAYYGVDKYRGSDQDYSPLAYSTTKWIGGGNKLFTAGVPVDSVIINDNRAMEEKSHHKAHIQLQSGNSQIWARLVRSSVEYLTGRSAIENNRSFNGMTQAYMYQQLTFQGDHVIEAGRNVEVYLRAGYDIHDLVRQYTSKPDILDYSYGMREREVTFRQLTTWTPHPSHSLASGIEYSREWFGERPKSLTGDPAHSGSTTLEPWKTNMIGIMGEYQWNAHREWTLFLGGRADHHSFTEWMYSPKAAVVFKPSDRYTTKLLYNQSVRKDEDSALKNQNDNDLSGDTEKINSLELRQDTNLGKNLTVSSAVLWYRFDSIAWVSGEGAKPVGRSEVFGLETELAYRTREHTITGSYSYTKLLDYTLADENIKNQLESSAPYGYGNDLHHWPRHIGKLTWQWQASQRMTALASARLFWGYQGAQKYAEYNNEVLKLNSSTRTIDGRTDAFEGSVFLNLGATYDLGRGFQASFHAYNILGWLQRDLNKRNFFGRMGGYRSEAPAFSIRLGYEL